MQQAPSLLEPLSGSCGRSISNTLQETETVQGDLWRVLCFWGECGQRGQAKSWHTPGQVCSLHAWCLALQKVRWKLVVLSRRTICGALWQFPTEPPQTNTWNKHKIKTYWNTLGLIQSTPKQRKGLPSLIYRSSNKISGYWVSHADWQQFNVAIDSQLLSFVRPRRDPNE